MVGRGVWRLRGKRGWGWSVGWDMNDDGGVRLRLRCGRDGMGWCFLVV